MTNVDFNYCDFNYYDFNYCVWAVFAEKHPWNDITDGFRPHMTVKSCLELESARELRNNIYDSWKGICIDLEKSKPYPTVTSYSSNNDTDKGFMALQTNVIPCQYLSEFPSEAHVSWRYRYDRRFTEQEIKNFEPIENVTAEIVDIIVMNCNGHYSTWHKMNDV